MVFWSKGVRENSLSLSIFDIVFYYFMRFGKIYDLEYNSLKKNCREPFMYENLIIEEDTVYEVDVECLCEKEKKEEEEKNDRAKNYRG